MASLDPARHPVEWHGAMGDVVHYAYTDERAALGHFVEHVWMHPDLRAQLAGVIPAYVRLDRRPGSHPSTRRVQMSSRHAVPIAQCGHRRL